MMIHFTQTNRMWLQIQIKDNPIWSVTDQRNCSLFFQLKREKRKTLTFLLHCGLFILCYNRGDAIQKTSEVSRITHHIYQCNECSEICENKQDFRMHYKMHMKAKEGEKKVLQQDSQKEVDFSKMATLLYRCIPCNTICNMAEIKRHRQRHKYHQSNICDLCGMMFDNRKSWTRHKLKHMGEKTGDWFVCKLCGKKFVLHNELKTHMLRHKKERPYVCEVCGKAFKSKPTLDRHRFLHSDVKPLSCEFCGKGFASNYNLKGHLRTHTGEKPFKCDVCDAAFTHNVSLKTHKRSAHGIDMWKDQKPSSLQEFDLDFVDIKFERTKVETTKEMTEDHSGENPVSGQSEKSQVEDVKGREGGTASKSKPSKRFLKGNLVLKQDTGTPVEPPSQMPQVSRYVQPAPGRGEASFLPVLMSPLLMHNIQGMHSFDHPAHGRGDFDMSSEPSSSQMRRVTDNWVNEQQFTNL